MPKKLNKLMTTYSNKIGMNEMRVNDIANV